jgi:hypothetical protein
MSAEPPAATPAQDPATAAEPGRFARALDVVRRLIDYGKDLAAAVLQRTPNIDFVARACNFGTNDIRLIIARITQGLLRAQALEARLERIAPRLDPKPKATPSQREPRTVRAARQVAATDPGLVAHLPTAEQIAAEVRRQPIGRVIADICRDLGILPCHPLWGELGREIIRHGGSLARLFIDITNRPYPPGWHETTSAPWLAPATPCPAPGGTGPP